MEKYEGMFGPADAMSALDPAFEAAYAKAADALLAATLEFERITGRIVGSIELQKLDITEVQDRAPRYLRQAALHFLPKPGEVA